MGKVRLFSPRQAEAAQVLQGAGCTVRRRGELRFDADAHTLWDEICEERRKYVNPATVAVGHVPEEALIVIRPAGPDEVETVRVSYHSWSRGFSLHLPDLFRQLGMVVPRDRNWVVPVARYDQDPDWGVGLALHLGRKEERPVLPRQPRPADQAAAARA